MGINTVRQQIPATSLFHPLAFPTTFLLPCCFFPLLLHWVKLLDVPHRFYQRRQQTAIELHALLIFPLQSHPLQAEEPPAACTAHLTPHSPH